MDGQPSKYYIMPAGSMGVVTYYVIKSGVCSDFTEQNIIGFLDSVKGRHENAEFLGFPLITPDKADKNVTVIVASNIYGQAIIQQLHEQGFEDIIEAEEFVTKENGFAVLEQIQKDDIEGRYKQYNLHNIQDSLNGFLIGLKKSTGFLTKLKLEFVVTQRCTLKCRDCCALMQYYEKPVDLDEEKIIKSVERLFGFVDYARKVNIIGGEPFLAKGLAAVIDKLAEYRGQIGALEIITNGTLIPSEEVTQAMHRAKNKLIVRISYYGELSRKKNELIKHLRDWKISCDVKENLVWTKARVVSETTHSGDNTFHNCQSVCAQIMDGKLYYCNFSAHGDALRAFPRDSNNYVDLLSPDTDRETVRAYLERSSSLPACQYCSGINQTNPLIPAAIQTKEPLPYKKYL